MDLKKPKGTKDYFGHEYSKLSFLVKTLSNVVESYGFERVTFPVFEDKSLFVRTTGEDTDIVQKEIYEFKDKGDREIALRPEGTASIARLSLENKLIQRNEQRKFFYIEKMYRYERPQKGRQREFFQFGVESFNAKSFLSDVETIQLTEEILKSLNIGEYRLELNSIGSIETRHNYLKKLKEYLEPHFESLSEDSKKRFESNPLRILDSKDKADQQIIESAPKIIDYLTQDELSNFKSIIHMLDELNIEYHINEKLVRGLDYYNDLVFEYIDIANDLTILGGGRYDKLINTLSEKQDVSAIGFALGIDRILPLIDINEVENDYYIGMIDKPISSNSELLILKEANYLRKNNFRVITNFETFKFNNHLKKAKENHCKKIILLDNVNNDLFVIDSNTNTKTSYKFNEE